MEVITSVQRRRRWTPKEKDLYKECYETMYAAIEMMKAGNTTADVDKAQRDIIDLFRSSILPKSIQALEAWAGADRSRARQSLAGG